MIITLEWVEQENACEDERDMFVARFGESVDTKDITPEQTHGFDTEWLFAKLLTDVERSAVRIMRRVFNAETRAAAIKLREEHRDLLDSDEYFEVYNKLWQGHYNRLNELMLAIINSRWED